MAACQASKQQACLRSQALHVAQTGGVAVVVRNDDGWVEWLEVQHDHWVTVEARFGLHHQWNALRRPLLGSLLDARRQGDVVQRLGQAKHHWLNAVLGGQERVDGLDECLLNPLPSQPWSTNLTIEVKENTAKKLFMGLWNPSTPLQKISSCKTTFQPIRSWRVPTRLSVLFADFWFA